MLHQILPKKEGWLSKSIDASIDMIILGMHARSDNPELLKAKKLNIPIVSFPEYIFKYAENKTRVVIAGSHGKTTITSMILHVLNDYELKVDYLLGAKINSLNNLVQLQNNSVILIEGDEYFSSPIDRQPKFMHYQPDILVVSGVSWDHVNVYPTIESYHNAFTSIINNVIKRNGQVFYCGDDSFLSKLSINPIYAKPYYLPDYFVENSKFYIQNQYGEIPLNIFGQHNLYNLEAAQLVCEKLGISSEMFFKSIQTFSGADKRLQLINKNTKNSCVYYDFAHSPSKVQATINAVKELYPDRYLITCLQLYTFSSLNIDFIPNYADVFDNSNEVWIYIDELALLQKNLLEISDAFLLKVINHHNVRVIKNKITLQNNLNSCKFINTNLLLMSSGNFSGLDLKSILN